MITQQIRRLAAASIFFLIAIYLIPGKLLAQDASVSTVPSGTAAKAEPQQDFSLQQAIDYGLQNNLLIKNGQLDILSAKAAIGERRAEGLPQISAQGNITDNVKIPTSFLPAVFFNPNASPDAPPVPVQFGVQYAGSGSINGNQIIFDASYFLGLKAANTYSQLSEKGLKQSKIEVVAEISKAYYAVLVSQQRLALLDYNVKRLDTLYQQTKLQNENGIVEKLEVDRIEVQYNNLKVDQQNAIRGLEVNEAILKFNMGYKYNEPIRVTDKLIALNVENLQSEDISKFNYGQRIEYSILQTQKELNWLDIRYNRSGYFPKLSAFGAMGYTRGSNKFDFLNQAWFSNASIGLNLTIPIFDGLRKHYKNQQAKLAYQKTDNSLKRLENNINLQLEQANITLTNKLNVLKTQRKNLELAEQVSKVTRIKYTQGVGSNIEVTTAEAAFKEAQINYYSALFDALVAKVDSDKAAGKLYVE